MFNKSRLLHWILHRLLQISILHGDNKVRIRKKSFRFEFGFWMLRNNYGSHGLLSDTHDKNKITNQTIADIGSKSEVSSTKQTHRGELKLSKPPISNLGVY